VYFDFTIVKMETAELLKVVVEEAQFPRDVEVVTQLFTSYAASLGIDLSYQSFTTEVQSLPGKYASSDGGALFLAVKTDITSTPASPTQRPSEVIGCVALRAFNAPQSCELKRLYITPDNRRFGAGRKLLERVIEEAKKVGYEEMLLDTLENMTAARKMYREYGFEECEKYYQTPVEGTAFMRLKLE